MNGPNLPDRDDDSTNLGAGEDDAPLRAIHALAGGLVDYAGLFPPAKLGMPAAVKNYGQYASGPHAWMLGRFITPVSRLKELEQAAAGHLPTSDDKFPWPLSVLIDGDLDENLDEIFAFNDRHSHAKAGLAVVDAVEIKVPGPGTAGAEFIDQALESMPEELYPFFEIPLVDPKGGPVDVRGLTAALSGADAGAKVRTGGVTPDAIPQARAVAEFLLACKLADVPFKATAGLHHAVRAVHPLTYEPGCPTGLMHGFLNVFIAAAFVWHGLSDPARVTRILELTKPGELGISDAGVRLGNNTLDVEMLQDARENFALSYGSCSFDEPVQELLALKLID